MKEQRYLLDEYGQPKISLCRYDPKHCGCITKSVLSEDSTHYNCEKCGATK